MNTGNNEDYYKQVAEELQNGIYDQELWDQALSEFDGDENGALAKYKVLRVRRLSRNETTESKGQKEDKEWKPEKVIEVTPVPDKSSTPKSNKSTSSFILTSIFYFCFIWGMGYIGNTMKLNYNLSNQRAMKLRLIPVHEVNKLISDWQKLRRTKEFKRLNSSEQKKLQDKFDRERVAAGKESSGTSESSHEWQQELGFIIAILLINFFVFIAISRLAGHLKMGCLSTLILTAIPIFGWLILVYLGVKNNFETDT